MTPVELEACGSFVLMLDRLKENPEISDEAFRRVVRNALPILLAPTNGQEVREPATA